jgi:hypothetical protein
MMEITRLQNLHLSVSARQISQNPVGNDTLNLLFLIRPHYNKGDRAHNALSQGQFPNLDLFAQLTLWKQFLRPQGVLITFKEMVLSAGDIPKTSFRLLFYENGKV